MIPSPAPSHGPSITDPQEHVRAGHEAERQGRLRDARLHFEAALHALRAPVEPGLAARLLRWIAWLHTNEGDCQAAYDCLDAAEAVATAHGDDRALASALNTRAGTLFGLGELDEAEAIFQRVRSLAVRIRDRKLEAMADQNLGSVASIRGDTEVALARFQTSLAKYESLDESAYVGPLLNNIGRLQVELQEDAEAGRTLARARAMCVREGDRHHLIIVDVNRARLMLRAGDALAALRTAESARELAEATGDDRFLTDIQLMCGASHLELGNAEVALHFLDHAAELARQREDPKALADVVLEQARALRILGRNRDTLVSLNEAHALFQKLKARRDLVNVGERMWELEAAFLEIVRDWGESIEGKDSYTQGHCTRVAHYACLLAEAAGLSRTDLTWFRMGALLHDVGKVTVPLEILNKKGKLDEEEWKIMARHPVEGVSLVEGIEFPWDVRPMIRHHHERVDGTGYPDRVVGEEIPFEARILTIADIYDALTTTRSYRRAFTHDQATVVMAAESGMSVDPDLFELFLDEVEPRIVPLPQRELHRRRRRRTAQAS